MSNDPRFWFPAKRYGWGWGLPTVWEGWVTLFVFVALVTAGVFRFPPVQQPKRFIVYTLAVCCSLIAVGWLKGEPPRWRWGKD